MEKDFFDLYERHSNLVLEVGHNSVADWCITVYDKRNKTIGESKPIIQIQACDRLSAFAEAYVSLSKYFSENMGGY